MTSPLLRQLASALWTDDLRTRIRLQRLTLTLALYVECGLAMAWLTRWEAVGGFDILAWTAAGIGGQLVFFALIRSGWSRRLAEPSMSMAQIAFGIAAVASGYAMAAQARSATLMPLFLIMVFGAFTVSWQRMVGLTAVALAVLAGTMFSMHALHPGRYDRVVDVSNFIMVAVVLPGISLIAILLGRMRTRLVSQRGELRDALSRIQELATLDALTGLPNRRRAQEQLDAESARALRANQGFAVALVDLDHFKRLNDRFGHAGGDAVLCRFAAEAREVLRETDTVARWGGEEFLVLMPGALEHDAVAALERLRERVAATGVPSAAGMMRFTLSAGVASHAPGQALSETVARADRALYRAKAVGRNRIEVAGAPGRPPEPAPMAAITRRRSSTSPAAPPASEPSPAHPASLPDGSPAADSPQAAGR
jgi:diguanylate cyclase (GGDEF)-like protein